MMFYGDLDDIVDVLRMSIGWCCVVVFGSGCLEIGKGLSPRIYLPMNQV